MKNRGAVIGLLLMCMSLATMLAQPVGKPSQEQREKRKARMKEMKKAFIKTELDLTEEEEEVFWLIYDEYDNNRDALRREYRSLRKQFKGNSLDDLSESEAEDMLTKEMEFREKRLALDKDFEKELKSNLSAKKIILLHKAERKFKKQLLDRMKGRRGGEEMDRRGLGPGNLPPSGLRN